MAILYWRWQLWQQRLFDFIAIGADGEANTLQSMESTSSMLYFENAKWHVELGEDVIQHAVLQWCFHCHMRRMWHVTWVLHQIHWNGTTDAFLTLTSSGPAPIELNGPIPISFDVSSSKPFDFNCDSQIDYQVTTSLFTVTQLLASFSNMLWPPSVLGSRLAGSLLWVDIPGSLF